MHVHPFVPPPQTAWIWALFACYLFYELGVLLRSGRIAFFKTSRKPIWSDFGTVFVFETLATVGMAGLVFVVLPEMDVVRGCMITNCVAIVPLFLSFMSRQGDSNNNKIWRVSGRRIKGSCVRSSIYKRLDKRRQRLE